jgi:hypothetical protein
VQALVSITLAEYVTIAVEKETLFTARILRDNNTMEKIMTEGEEVISYNNSLTN